MQTMTDRGIEASMGNAPPGGGGPRPARSRTGRALVVAGLAVALFGAGATGLFRSVRSEPSVVPHRVALSASESPVIASGTLSQTIAGLQGRLRAFPQDWHSWAALGLAYVQQARITADPGYYPKAEAVLRKSLSIQPSGNFDALTGLGALAGARHDFAGALAYGERAARINPYNANVHGVMGDALIELGRYPEAFAELQKMVDLRPGLSSYARVSYARELQGDPKDAARLMSMAFDDATTPADRAWVSSQLGDLAFNAGDLAAAAMSYRRAQAMDPAFVPAAAGLAKVRAARGRVSAAIAGYRRVVGVYPLPEYVIALIDLETVAGHAADAARDSALLHLEERLFRAGGVNMDLEVALFDADHGVNPAEGLAAARREWDRRKSIVVADVLAWALYANGNYREALSYANRALSLGTDNALYLFHRGMIERALARPGAARRDLRRAVRINAHFSVLWEDRATRALASLEAAR